MSQMEKNWDKVNFLLVFLVI